ncbi:MAG: DNA topoisomerase [Bdellovibrionota bacterium]
MIRIQVNSKPDGITIVDEKRAQALLTQLNSKPWRVESVEEKDFTSKPTAPFITSTLQQEASRKLGFTARVTMRTAQRLYEQGLITYMRTDSPTLSEQALQATRTQVEELYGKEFLSDKPRQFSAKTKAAQEAHEAIRPAGQAFQKPDETGLTDRELKLYDLIWKRTLASQMAEAKKKSMQVRISVENCSFAASGMKIVFPGFLRVYVEGKDSPDEALEDKEVLLPDLQQNDVVDCKDLESVAHETKPVARYTEASLIQALEKSGIGRPSTYASIISTILDREYATKHGTALVPSYTGFVVIQLLEDHFEELVDYGFSSTMEEALDEIASGNKQSIPYLTEFFLGDDGLQAKIEKREEKIDPDHAREVKLLRTFDNVELRVGRFGPYLIKKMPKGEEDLRASIPNDIAPSELTNDKVQEIIEVSKKGPQPIGTHLTPVKIFMRCLA